MAPARVDPERLAERLRANKTHGAAELARQALGALRECAGVIEGHDESALLHCAEVLRDARPSMGAIRRIVQHWIDTLPPARDPIAQRGVAHSDAVLRLADAALNDTARIARRHLATTPGAILTHSASSTVVRVLSERPASEVVVTASEPGGEGRSLAAKLGANCIEDRDAARAVSGCAAVLVGADAVGRRGFVNKVGTRTLALAARDLGRPFLVVAESFKRVDADVPPVTETLFEAIPNDLVTAFLMDDRFFGSTVADRPDR